MKTCNTHTLVLALIHTLSTDEGISEEAYNLMYDMLRKLKVVDLPEIRNVLQSVDATDGSFYLPYDYQLSYTVDGVFTVPEGDTGFAPLFKELLTSSGLSDNAYRCMNELAYELGVNVFDIQCQVDATDDNFYIKED
jgi:hypothetical protein